MKSIKLFFVFLFLISCSKSEVDVPLINAHAHNDYEHNHPLFDALENKFISIEVDIYLINDQFYVSHDEPKKLDSLKTLENLYLKPLQKIINKNNGKVYSNYEGFFYLMIDIKTDATLSYNRLKNILMRYETIISKVVNGKEESNKPIKIVITGFKGRPFNQILADEPRLMAIDGRFKELNRNISNEIMPYISENYNNYLSYSGKGKPSLKDKNTLSNLVDMTHIEGKKLRFWASPENEAVWNFLLNHRVDLINTDSLSEFNHYMSKRKN